MRLENKKSETVYPRAYWIRLASVAAVFVSAYSILSSSHDSLFSLSATTIVAILTIHWWGGFINSVVYIIVGTVQFKGPPGAVIPAGVRISTSPGAGMYEFRGQEYITTKDVSVGTDGIAEVEVCVEASRVGRKI